MRAGRRDSLYDSNRDQFAVAISPKRGLLNAYTPTFTLCVHTHDFSAKMCSGLESIEDRFGRTHSAVAEMPAGTLPEKREKRWGENVCAPRIRAYLPLSG